MYGHKYYLTPEEQQKFEPSDDLENIDKTVDANYSDSSSEPKSKKPRTSDDYRTYKNVLPSARIVGDYKHNKALHQEIAAARALENLVDGTKVTLHFDTTGRSQIDGEWPSLILNFLSDNKNQCRVFYLRALFFAFEDRQQIVKLIVETFKRLSVATGGTSSPKNLWENITSFMTDAVVKNLKVEDEVSKIFESNHIPYHVLCNSHTCGEIDEACLHALISVEAEINYPTLIIKRQPQLKSFVRQTKCIALAAIKAMLKLVAHEESAKPTS